jgi:solute carrier family 35 protein
MLSEMSVVNLWCSVGQLITQMCFLCRASRSVRTYTTYVGKSNMVTTDVEAGSSLFLRMGSAAFYGAASFLITVVNKTVLTTYHFPSYQVLGIGQMVATVIILYVCKRLGLLSFPHLDSSVFRKIWPLPLIYVGNLVFGLGGTKVRYM